MNKIFSRDDYEKPRYLLNMDPEISRIPVFRVIEKLNSYLNKNDYDAAERHLQYWLNEAEAFHDTRGKLTVLNEQIGLFRKTSQETKCIQAISDALSLADALDIENSVTYGTTLINAATGYKAFGRPKDALHLYRKAQTIYESNLDAEDGRLGGLYNNLALALAELKEYREAEELYRKAIEVMQKQENGALEVAITYLNLADLITDKTGLESGENEITDYLLKAKALLNTESLPKNGYYAFVCEKCAPVFGYYGYFLFEKELNQRAREIYERA